LSRSRRHAVDLLLTDFDRTLVWLFEDRSRQREACQDVLAVRSRHGIPVPPGPDPAAGDPYDLWADAYRGMMASSSRSKAESLNSTIAARLDVHELGAAASVRLLTGVGRTLRRLRDMRIRVAVVSNNSTDAVWQALKANEMEAFVTTVFGREPDCDLATLKPSPFLLSKALAEFGVAPSRALFAGDSITDMVAGQAADVPTVGILGHSRVGREALLAAGAGQVVDTFAELEPLLADGPANRP
jgi:HAD superfamily hydrolase (TIGR01509 family)